MSHVANGGWTTLSKENHRFKAEALLKGDRMNKRQMIWTSLRAVLLVGAVAVFGGCEDKGPAERAGENIDKGVQNAKDAINPAGPMEKAGKKVDKALDH
jgi:hypothetical protein